MARMDWSRDRITRQAATGNRFKSAKYETQLQKQRDRTDAQANRSARYVRLLGGGWGLSVEGKPLAGSSVTVYKKDGTKTTEIIEKIVGSRGPYWYCTMRGKS
jgi:hypothetical protein